MCAAGGRYRLVRVTSATWLVSTVLVLVGNVRVVDAGRVPISEHGLPGDRQDGHMRDGRRERAKR
jgi:hypothetical protein